MDLSASTVEQLTLTAERANRLVDTALARRDAVLAVTARRVLTKVVAEFLARETSG